MTPREKFIAALERKPVTGRVPHFEIMFCPTMEKFGKIHPAHIGCFKQWEQMNAKERNLHVNYVADVHIMTAQEYEHGAIFLHIPFPGIDDVVQTIEAVREKTGNKYFLMIHGDATFGIPNGDQLESFAYRLADEPGKVKQEAEKMVNDRLERADYLSKHTSLDGFILCSDYCFNSGPFLSPAQFSEFVAPYLAKLIKAYRDMGFYTIKHTDGNIMPILDQLVQAGPHALHSLDPQGGVDIKEVKRLVGHKVCLIGNVNCGLLNTGTEASLLESARYALQNGMPGFGYIYSTSNSVFTGAELGRYEKMVELWKKEGNY